jgi:hypothetical protein
MTAPLLIPMPGNEGFGKTLSNPLGCETGALEVRHFPDGESYVRLVNDPKARTIVFLCTLDRPDEKILHLSSLRPRRLANWALHGLVSWRLISLTCARTGGSSPGRR